MRAPWPLVAVLALSLPGCNRSPVGSAAGGGGPTVTVGASRPADSEGAGGAATGPKGPALPSAREAEAWAGPGPFLLPPVVLPDGSVPIHASRIGWTADGWFGFCGRYGPGMAETRCTEASSALVTRRVAPDARRPRQAEAKDPQPVWRYGGTLRLSWEVQPAAEPRDGLPDRGATFVLRGGALGDPTLHVLDRFSIAPENPNITMHVDEIEPSADGAALGAVIHGYSGEWTDSYHLRVWATDDLASRTLNAIGLVHHQDGRYAEAAEFFERAVQAFDNPKASYNCACALARLADPRAEAALTAALKAGGPAVREKARTDPDFAGVRQEPWFRALVP